VSKKKELFFEEEGCGFKIVGKLESFLSIKGVKNDYKLETWGLAEFLFSYFYDFVTIDRQITLIFENCSSKQNEKSESLHKF
jgi:hypothetical protein